jgi:hypothetical protein
MAIASVALSFTTLTCVSAVNLPQIEEVYMEILVPLVDTADAGEPYFLIRTEKSPQGLTFKILNALRFNMALYSC